MHALAAYPSSSSPLPHLLTPLPQLQQHVTQLRNQVLGLLSGVLGGDALAAEYLLLTMLGSVFSRAEGGAHGVLAMNLTNCPEAAEEGAGAREQPKSSSFYQQ